MKEKVKIIVVDDEIYNLQLLEIILGKEFNIVTNQNGEETLALFKKHPDTKLLISDYRMPKIDGIQIAEKVKEKYPKMPIFLLTGFVVSEEIAEANKKGIIDKYLQKPLNKAEILEAIHEVLA